MTQATPTFAGNYRIEKELGAGAMATVYLAHHTRIPEKKVAVKIVDNNHPDLIARFEREAQLLAAVKHHHLVQIHDFGKIGNQKFYIAMDYIEGCDLRELIDQYITRRQYFDPLLIIKILKEVCIALKVTHDSGIVHRDLKPENIMLEETVLDPHFVRVLDFGIAKMLDDVEDNPKRFQTMVGMICGTPQYLSPEQAQGHELDGRSDLYALGCILYEMLSLQLPFTADKPAAYLVKHISEEPFPLEFRAPHSNMYLRRLAHLLLSKEPDDRPNDALEVYEALVDIEDAIRVEDAKQRNPRRNSKIMRLYTPPPPPNTTSLAGLVSETNMPVGIAVDESRPNSSTTDEIQVAISPLQRFFRNRYAWGGMTLAALALILFAIFTSSKEQLLELGEFFEPVSVSQAQPRNIKVISAQVADEIPVAVPRRDIVSELPQSPLIEKLETVYARVELEHETRQERSQAPATAPAAVVVTEKREPTLAQKLAKAKALSKQAKTRESGCAELRRLFSTPVKNEARANYNVYCTE